MSQSGLRHAATEPDHLDAKRERGRRGGGGGGGGRAAALRRAPSDSDCSAETASLSADSADRVRPQLVPIRTTKARSRRRGSEWEVLEGLKDGQRFERRPEVFNGYLHKKRKWPLKGWHKRFFVIDGGILVYARSPSDVARGRLHGSVDVGLSVISAKARRRRIDIDADEFIYHLRAKTPDVFRTWLNVLKVHRLYRQHLLTFGARESVAKIHTPLDELPPADTSTPSSSSSLLTPSCQYSVDDLLRALDETPSPPPVNAYFHSKSYHNPVYDWTYDVEDNTELVPLTFENLDEDFVKPNLCNRSLCSMNCLEKIYKRELVELLQNRNKPESVRASIAERQLHTTELERNSLRIDPYIESSIFNDISTVSKITETVTKDRPIRPVFPVFSDTDEAPAEKKKIIKVRKPREKSSLFRKKTEPTTTYFLFAHKKHRPRSPDSQMKRSKKSTNLVKYRNCSEEPPLDKPFSAPMLLKNCRTNNKVETNSGNEIYKVEAGSGNDLTTVDRSAGDETTTVDHQVQTSLKSVAKRNQSLQDTMTASEYDKITEQLIISIFGANKPHNDNNNIKCYVGQMVKELYEVQLNQTEAHPVTILFRSLLEYWLKNSSTENMKSSIKNVKSVVTQSNILTRDENLSSLYISNITKETQIQQSNCVDTNIDVINAFNVASNNKRVTCSYMKERRIQELETLLKNTVYTLESVCSNQSKEKDIIITKRLLDNLDSRCYPQKTVGASSTLNTCQCDVCMQSQNPSSSSAEYLKIKENVNHLISEISIPPECLKEFLEAYLKVLKNVDNNTQSTDDSKTQENRALSCDVQTESVQRKVSVGVYTIEKNTINNNNVTYTKTRLVDTGQDSGQFYLKGVLDKVTTIFAEQNVSKSSEDKTVQPDDTKAEGPVKKSIKDDYTNKTLMLENKEEHSVVIDLTKYDLEHISMCSDPTLKGTVSITIKLKERPPDSRDSKQKNINLMFSEESSVMSPLKKNNLYKSPNCTTKNYCRPKMDPRISFKNPYIHYDPNKERKDLKSFVSISDATSKAYRVMYENANSRSSESPDQPGRIVSPVKRSPRSSVFQPKRKYRTASRNQSVKSLNKRKEMFDKPVGPIDENFIFLLLENLTLLSQNVPGLYNEISVFYLKLKRKHDKERTAGVGLLGKIYNESCQHDEESDVRRQGDVTCACYSQKQGSNSNTDIEISTNDNTTSRRIDQGTSVVSELKDVTTQCNEVTYKKNRPTINLAVSTSSNPFSVRHAHMGSRQENRTVETADVALSSPNWFQKMTRDCAMTTAIRKILNSKGSCSNFRFVNDSDKFRKAQICENRSQARSQVKQTLKLPNKVSMEPEHKRKCVEIDMRSILTKKSSLEDSRRRQTRSPNCTFIQMNHQDDVIAKDSRRAKFFNAYPIITDTGFLRNASRVTNVSSRELGSVSDDVRTIYRCSSSVPSFVSG